MNPAKPILLAFSLAAFGCSVGGEPGDEEIDPIDEETPDPQDTSGGEDNTFEHPDGPDIWDYLQRLAEEGPPSFSARMHSCPKMTYSRIGNILESRGVDLGAGGNLSAGRLWRNGGPALGAPKLDVRSRESTELTTAAAAKLFDVFAQAAPEIIAAMPTLEACMVGGVGAEMFDGSGQCTADGISCLMGTPAQPAHVELCNEMVSRATTIEIGQEIAVAALAAAAHTCE